MMVTEKINEVRKQIIRIERLLKSDIIAYFMADRQGAPNANIGEDAVRPLYEHILTLKKNNFAKSKLCLFLYSRGGAVEVPWRIVSMIREQYSEFGVIIPYKAHSATTMIALGADEIIMSAKGELGPIDPSLGIKQDQEGVVNKQINVEDVMSYIAFLKDKAGLTDQDAISSSVDILSQKLEPWLIGGMYRIKEHINLVARKLLSSRKDKLEENKIQAIIEALVEKTYFHGHAICRKEALDLGLPIKKPEKNIEKGIWEIYKIYELFFKLNEPIDAEYTVEQTQQDYSEENYPIACIQSRLKYHEYNGKLHFKVVRQPPPQLNLSLNINLQLPPTIQPNQLNPQLANDFVRQLQSQITEEVGRQVQNQSPIVGVKGSFVNKGWREMEYPKDIPTVAGTQKKEKRQSK
jgi:hypothetical protein